MRVALHLDRPFGQVGLVDTAKSNVVIDDRPGQRVSYMTAPRTSTSVTWSVPVPTTCNTFHSRRRTRPSATPRGRFGSSLLPSAGRLDETGLGTFVPVHVAIPHFTRSRSAAAPIAVPAATLVPAHTQVTIVLVLAVMVWSGCRCYCCRNSLFAENVHEQRTHVAIFSYDRYACRSGALSCCSTTNDEDGKQNSLATGFNRLADKVGR